MRSIAACSAGSVASVLSSRLRARATSSRVPRPTSRRASVRRSASRWLTSDWRANCVALLQAAQLEVVARDLGGDRGVRGVDAGLGGVDLRRRRFARAPVAAEEVELPVRGEAGVVDRAGALAARWCPGTALRARSERFDIGADADVRQAFGLRAFRLARASCRRAWAMRTSPLAASARSTRSRERRVVEAAPERRDVGGRRLRVGGARTGVDEAGVERARRRAGSRARRPRSRQSEQRDQRADGRCGRRARGVRPQTWPSPGCAAAARPQRAPAPPPPLRAGVVATAGGLDARARRLRSST